MEFCTCVKKQGIEFHASGTFFFFFFFFKRGSYDLTKQNTVTKKFWELVRSTEYSVVEYPFQPQEYNRKGYCSIA